MLNKSWIFVSTQEKLDLKFASFRHLGAFHMYFRYCSFALCPVGWTDIQTIVNNDLAYYTDPLAYFILFQCLRLIFSLQSQEYTFEFCLLLFLFSFWAFSSCMTPPWLDIHLLLIREDAVYCTIWIFIFIIHSLSRSCGRVKLPHFYCCSGDRGGSGEGN